MRFKILAASAAIALLAVTAVFTQAGAQTTSSIEIEQTAAKVTMVAGGCDTGAVTFTLVVPGGAIETVNGTSIGSGRYSHLIDITSATATGDYAVTAKCMSGSDTLVDYTSKTFTISPATAATATPQPSATAEATPEATAAPQATAAPTTAPTNPAMSLTASTTSLEIGKNAVITMTGCPEATPAAGDVYRSTFETTDPLGTTGTKHADYAGSSTHEMMFETSGTTQPGDHKVVGLCEKKAGDAWSEVHRYQTVTITVSGVATGGTETPTATPAATAVPATSTPSAIGFTG